MFLLQLAHHLPPLSPISREWPSTPDYLSDTSLLIRRLFHRWRVGRFTALISEYIWSTINNSTVCFMHPKCHVFRLRIDDNERNRMGEKVTASIIFKERKSSYARRYKLEFLFPK